ncbi:hypothetical protein M3Y99_01535700 [Aphelenchoides fujianensis]|nr:hypothetical protein M3Y99_01535700 [Aphelenchoides fujianensis]
MHRREKSPNVESTCRHLENGNAVCRFAIPAEEGEFRSQSYDFKRELGHELRFQTFCETKDEENEGDKTAELGVFISNFGAFSPVKLQLRCRVLGERSEVVAESEWDRFVFHRWRGERWKFEVPRSKLEDARKEHEELFAEFEVELDESVLQGLSRQLQQNEDGNVPYTPRDPEGTTFSLQELYVGKIAGEALRERFEDVEFFLRFFPPNERSGTSDFEFVLSRFFGRRRVSFAFEWAVENSKKETKFHHKGELRHLTVHSFGLLLSKVREFEFCGCPPNERCGHKRFRKMWHKVNAKELWDFVGRQPFRLLLKLRRDAPAAHGEMPKAAAINQTERTAAKRSRQMDEDDEEAGPPKLKKAKDERSLSIVVDGTEFQVDQELLIGESAFFARKLAKGEDLNEGLPDGISSETMAAVIEWIQKKQVADLDGRAHELYKACVESIKRTSKNSSEHHTAAVLFAAEHEDAELKQALESA